MQAAKFHLPSGANFKLLKSFLLILLSLPVFALATPSSQTVFGDLSRYNDINTVNNIFANQQITEKLQALLGSHYPEFITNFEGTGESHLTAEGGIFVEGWPEHLYREKASALVSEPDGKLYAAWKKPETNKIEYRSSEGDNRVIHRELAEWATRFDHMTFTDGEHFSALSSRWFITKGFAVQLTSLCQENDLDCASMAYYGIRKSDGAAVRLIGKAIFSSCDYSLCPVASYQFYNQNMSYVLNTVSSELVVSAGEKRVLTERGDWLADFTGVWSAENRQAEDDGSTFSLTLTQRGSQLSGRYCYVTQKGNRIDCAQEHEDNIHGKVEGEKASLVFDSTFGGKAGKAELLRNGDTLTWTLLEPPKGGDYYVPRHFNGLEMMSENSARAGSPAGS